jgi:8-oxo-dGTP diphosphatase
MKMDDKRYENQGIHVDIALFTVQDSLVKTLLVKRSNKQFIGEWIIPGGAVYNDESVDEAAKRELLGKTGIKGIYMEQFHTFGEVKRDPRKRMISVAYLALLDSQKVNLLTKTNKTDDAYWADISKLPKLGFDHNQIVESAIKTLRVKLATSNLANSILQKQFTLPELQKVYEIILGKKLDRRNFRRKFLSLKIIQNTGEKVVSGAFRPANLYSFTSNKYQEIDIY